MAITKTIPMEIIIEEILPRLPTKSLLRFKCVSKSWERLISSPEFATLQLRLSSRSDSNECLLIFPNETRTNEFFIQDLDSCSRHGSMLGIPVQFKENLSIVGSCNGLLCMLFAYPQELVVINPLTRCYRMIPFASEMYSGVVERQKFGFWYDSTADDYKIIRVVHYRVSLPSPRRGIVMLHVAVFQYVSEVAIYSLKDDSWRIIDCTAPWWNDLGDETAISGSVTNNHLVHWMVIENLQYCIVCFDVISEGFIGNVPLPDSYTNWKNNSKDLFNLGVLDGCLCLSTNIIEISSGCNQDITGLNVWIMKEYGVKESWVKLLHMSYGDTTSPPREIFPVVNHKGSRGGDFLLLHETCPRTDELSIKGKHESKLVWYDFNDKALKPFDLPGLSGKLKVCLHRASLIYVSESKRPRRFSSHAPELLHSFLYSSGANRLKRSLILQ